MGTLLFEGLRLFLNHEQRLSIANDVTVLSTQHMVVR